VAAGGAAPAAPRRCGALRPRVSQREVNRAGRRGGTIAARPALGGAGEPGRAHGYRRTSRKT
jgi:hypothetical protein